MQGVSGDETVPIAKEIHDRYLSHGNMTETDVLDTVTNEVTDVVVTGQPVFALDNCCTASKFLLDAGFPKPIVIGDYPRKNPC